MEKDIIALASFPATELPSPPLCSFSDANTAMSLLPLSAPSQMRTSRSAYLPFSAVRRGMTNAQIGESFHTDGASLFDLKRQTLLRAWKKLRLKSLKLCFYLALCLKAVFREGVIGDKILSEGFEVNTPGKTNSSNARSYNRAEPSEGMNFENANDAMTFYNTYGRNVGFGTGMSSSQRSESIHHFFDGFVQ
ncbi:hypothetical protein Taro_054138 [Colocasia esculenta]|uniref:NHR domain-containing protein n=1 Tax=Colocasia esculenta TaxID=4460 RepID=A0A843XMX5_COLES|nr:hypothetical protein [Colocasia esculenta]